jgi:PAS domain S-box-containing protein
LLEDAQVREIAMNSLVEQNETVIEAGTTYARMLGFTSAELHGMPIGSLVASSDRDRLRDYGRARADGADAPGHYSFRALARDGHPVPVVASISTRRAGDATTIVTTVEPDLAWMQDDAQSIELLYDYAAPEVYSLLRHMLRDESAASSAMHATFADAVRHCDGCGEGSVLSWLLAIAREQAVTRLDRASVTRPSPVGGAFGALPRELAEVMNLAYFGAMKPAEIAAWLGVPADIVRQRIIDGMRILRAGSHRADA